MLAIINSLGETVQTIGLILDVIGVLLIVNFFRKITYEESSSYGLITNMPELLSTLTNGARIGSIFLVLGFIFQLIGVWI
ncbi:MAG: hypothetical protein JJV95_04080 [Sulfurospirillum sp.]|nr:hypothetical protein [Sulfurospirillum sp.]